MDKRFPLGLPAALALLVACAPDSGTNVPGQSSGAGVGGSSLVAGSPAAVGGNRAVVVPAGGAGSAAVPVAGSPSAPGMQQPGGGDRGPRGQTGGAGQAAPGGPGPGPRAGAGGAAPAAGGAPASGSAGAGAAGSGGGADDFEAQRVACVETINMYRATLMLPPLTRASRELEACSDMGAKKDGDNNAPHSSAGDCRPLGAQNTCPGYPARNGDVTASLNQCLGQMWAEGMPPVPVDECIRDTAGCFQMHGHWINMQSATSKQVACGFYKMANGRYWMNQNFGR